MLGIYCRYISNITYSKGVHTAFPFTLLINLNYNALIVTTMREGRKAKRFWGDGLKSGGKSYPYLGFEPPTGLAFSEPSLRSVDVHEGRSAKFGHVTKVTSKFLREPRILKKVYPDSR